MIRRIRTSHILSGELEELMGEPYVLDCRNIDIPNTIRMMIRNAPPGYAEPDSGYPVLIVDDVLTTGRSFIEAKARLGNPEGTIGVVVAARGRCPNWVWPILSVNEWAQSRATGLG